MRAPTPALIHARAKAPLASLEVLHLSDTGIDCIKHLETCRCLRSLYADGNRLTSSDTIAELRHLWRIDLSGNRLRDISALASFRALGFLNLERNYLSFEAVASLRGIHIIDLRLIGNDDLRGSTQQLAYRKQVTALLPTIWTLDGHYISASERNFSLEECKEFTATVLSASKHSNEAPSRSILWSSGSSNVFGASEHHGNASKLLDIVLREPEHRLVHDLHRLRGLVDFYNEEAGVHNAHVTFASKRGLNARVMPSVSLDLLQQLPRKTRLGVTTLLAAFIRFQFEQALLIEALTLELLETTIPTDVIHEMATLPSYVLTALIAALRFETIGEEEELRRSQNRETHTEEFATQSQAWRSIPTIVTTLLPGSNFLESNEDAFMSVWCGLAVQLLSRAASFPQPDVSFSKRKTPSTSFARIAPLLASANGTQGCPEDPTGTTSLTVSVSNSFRQDGTHLTFSHAYERSRAAQANSNSALGRSQSVPNLDKPTFTSDISAPRRHPRPGEWLEIQPKRFVKIISTSVDGAFVSAAPLSQSSPALTISSKQLIRMSGNAWRIADYARINDFDSRTIHRFSSPLNSLSGKLHRDSESFHRHGAARNQGFPNFEVDSESVKCTGISDAVGRKLTRSVELFASNDTLDANYVLASPHAIAVQNFCASKHFHEQNLAPGGLWKPIELAAPYHVVATNLVDAKSSQTKVIMPNAVITASSASSESVRDRRDEWDDIKQQLQTVLGITRPSSRSGSESGSTRAPSPTPANSSIPPRQPRLQPLRVSWHAVPTKPSYLVASPSQHQLKGSPAISKTTTNISTSNSKTTSNNISNASLRSSFKPKLPSV